MATEALQTGDLCLISNKLTKIGEILMNRIIQVTFYSPLTRELL